MKKFLLCLFAIIIAIITFFVGMDKRVAGDPSEAYQVYLDGEKIGLIKSKNELLNLIDQEQSSFKSLYNVDKVYPPLGLSVEKIFTYDKNISNVNDIYEQIKDKEPFTIQGYMVTINYPKPENEEEEQKEPLKIGILNKDFIKNSLYNIAVAFIGKNSLQDYENNTQVKITETGEIITSIYFGETITVKEDLLSTKEKIFTNEDELTQYLLYGTNDQHESYVVKDGENLQKIADEHSLNIEELMIANPKYSSPNVLLTAGETLSVSLINPLVDVVYRKQVVEDVNVPYNTVYQDDPNKDKTYSEIIQNGINGKTRVTEDVLYTNGQIRSLNITKRDVLANAVDEVIKRGTKVYSNQWTGRGEYDPNAGGSRNFGWPTLTPYIITSYYEWRWGDHHNGIDISGTGRGSPIYSSTDGTVIYTFNGCSNYGWYGSSCGSGFGNHIIIKTNDGAYDIVYGHLQKNLRVSVGSSITRGQIIGYMGSSGSSTGVHLHWQINYSGTRTALNPCKVAFRC